MKKFLPADELNKLGLQSLSEKVWDEAISCFREAVRQDPENPEYHENLGLALRGHGEDAEAARALRHAISLKPRSPRSVAALGELMMEHCNTTGAIECFRKAFETQPATGWGHAQMARAFLAEGNTESAAECAQLSITLDASLAQAYTILGSAMQELGRFSEAQDALERSIQIQSDQAEAYFKLVYGKKVDQSDRSLIKCMQRVLDGGRRTLEERRLLNYALGKAHEDLAKFEIAMQHYDRANQAALALQLGTQPFDKAAYRTDADRSIEKFTKRFFKQNAHLGSLSETPIFIIGMIRSGTTLLEQILGCHSSIGAGGETHFWMGKGARAIRAIIDSPTPSSPKQVWDEYLSMLKAVGSGKHYVTDKDPLNFRFLGEIHFAFPKARFVHCRRCPMDNCLSIYTTPYRVPAEFSYNRENIAFAYKEYLRLMDHWRAVLPEGKMIEVDYEALAQEPEATTRKILQFLGLELEEACLTHEAKKGRIGTPSFWQARQPVYSGSVDRAMRFEGFLGAFDQLVRGS